MITYTVREYIENYDDIALKIKAIDNLIDAMMLNLADCIDDSGTASFSMDDGQMKISTEYRSIDQVQSGLKALEIMKQRYINRYNGRVTILRGRANY